MAPTLVLGLLEYRDKPNYRLHEFVVMPNHLHLLLTPAESVSLEKVMQFIWGGSSHAIHAARGTHQQIWRPGFHESRVKDLANYKIKSDYIQFNPVTAKLVHKREDWPFASASASFAVDPIPQGLKPSEYSAPNVGAEAPNPKSEAPTPKS